MSSEDGTPIVVGEKAIGIPTRRRAFLVAADDYGDKAPSLPGAKKDVEALAKKLIEIGFDESDVVVLKTGDGAVHPTQNEIRRMFNAFSENLKKGDFVVVYLSGHGIQNAAGESFFAPVDVDPARLVETSGSINDKMSKLGSSKASFRWMIVDACRENPEAKGERAPFGALRSFGGRGMVDPLAVPKSLLLLQSCSPGQLSYEGGHGRAQHIENGLFTLSLLEGLDRNGAKADANADGVLTFSELFTYVSGRTNDMAWEYYDAIQKPCLSGFATDFALLTDDEITPAKRKEAEKLYKEAVDLCGEEKWKETLEKINAALEIDPKNEKYLQVKKHAEDVVKALAKPPKVVKEQVVVEKPVVVKEQVVVEKPVVVKEQVPVPVAQPVPVPVAQPGAVAQPIATGPPVQTSVTPVAPQFQIPTTINWSQLQIPVAPNQTGERGVFGGGGFGGGNPDAPSFVVWTTTQMLDTAMYYNRPDNVLGKNRSALVYEGCRLIFEGQDPTLAAQYFQQAANDGRSFALLCLGICHLHGIGVPQDPALAFQCFVTADVNEQTPGAKVCVALCYLGGYGVPKNWAQGWELMEFAAQRGHSLAQFIMGLRYTVSGDRQKAINYFQWCRGDRTLGQAARMMLNDLGVAP
ncbi:MAG: caspase family protein [Thermoguttaceae bacterium]|nr:caspase family protein [Thermoguttaceae bacterium]